MLESRSSNELDIAYMPYHEGLVNHKAPPVRGSLSVCVSNQQQYSQQTSYYCDSDDDDVSDDPAWMNAPRGSLQPAFPPSLMKKASTWSATDSQTSSPVSNFVCSTEEEDEEEQEKTRMNKKDDDDSKDNDDEECPSKKLTTPSSSCPEAFTCRNVDDKLTIESEVHKAKPANQDRATPVISNTVVNLAVPRNSRGNMAIGRMSAGKKGSDVSVKGLASSASAAMDEVKNGYRGSMMRYCPSDLKPQDLTKVMMSRDSLAPENFESSTGLCSSSRTSDMVGSSRRSNLFDGSRSKNSGDIRGSVMHFGPRVKEEGLSDYLRAAKSGNLHMLRICLQDRKTNLTERDPLHGQSAMHIAVRFGQLHAVQLLCGNKTRSLLIDAVDNRQNTPLHLASAKSRRIAKYLLEHGADASRVNNRNQTPLAVHIITTKRDDPMMTEMLLQHKTDPNGSLGNSTLLHKAVDLKFYEIAYRLVRHGARLDVKDPAGKMVFEKVDGKILRQLCGRISYPPVWVSNAERKSCMSCLRKFSLLGVGVRRHHCRFCGRLVCGRCSHVSIESEAFPATFIGHIDRNPSDERSNIKRVCNTCSSVFDERAKQVSSPGGSGKWSEAFMGRVLGCSWDEIEPTKKNNNNNTELSQRRSFAI